MNFVVDLERRKGGGAAPPPGGGGEGGGSGGSGESGGEGLYRRESHEAYHLLARAGPGMRMRQQYGPYLYEQSAWQWQRRCIESDPSSKSATSRAPRPFSSVGLCRMGH